MVCCVPTMDDLWGITFYVDSPRHPRVSPGATRIADEDLAYNAHGGTAYGASIRPYLTLP